MRTRGSPLVVALLLTLLASCDRREAPRAFELGPHRGQVRVPAGWAALDHGRQWRLRKGEAELVLQDLGAAGPQGIRREVERARELWRVGRVDEARWRLRNVPVPRELFPTAVEREAFWAAWSAFLGDPAMVVPYAEIDPAFRDVLARVDALPPPDLPALADAGLKALGHDQRRDVKSRQALKVSGRDALDVETWNRLSHANPQRFLFIADDGYLLALYTARQADAEALRAFASVRDSLHFAAADSARR